LRLQFYQLPWNTHHSSQAGSHKEEHSHGDAEPIVIKRVAVHEKLAQEMKKSGIDSEALPLASHQLEHE
jgi:hypothetical protein